MELNIELRGVDEARKTLENIPGGLHFALRGAISHVLQRSKTEIARAVQKRYAVPSYGWILRAIGRPRFTGPTSAMISVSGSKVSLGMIPGMRDIFPGGVTVPERRDAPPISLLHAFARSGRVYMRETPQTKTYPIKTVFGLSVPAMAAQRTEVMPQIQERLQADLDTELQRLIRGVLSGSITPR
jgi:hypothetical protein